MIQTIITDVNELYSKPLDVLQNMLTQHDSISSEVNEAVKLIQNSFNSLKTEYQRTNSFKNSYVYIEPMQIHIGSSRSYKFKNSKTNLSMQDKQIQYIPIRDTLKLFFELPSILKDVNSFIEELQSETIILNITQTPLWHEIKTQSLKKYIYPIFIFFDDFEIGNPLGSHKGIHKIGGIYFSIPCLPHSVASHLENIFLLSFHHADDRSEFGNTSVFKKIVDDLKLLYEEGITTIDIDGVQYCIYFAVPLILGDNLGCNTIFGYIESFVGNHFFRYCRCSKFDCEKMLIENKAMLRNEINYNIDLQNLNNGVKQDCIFNELPYFAVWNNLCCDIMHDVYEGVCRYDLGNILYNLIYVDKFVSLEILNNRINSFNFRVSSNKPPLINKSQILKKHIIMSSAEMKTLTRNLGLIIGDLVPKTVTYWRIYSLLCDIIDINESKYVTVELSEHLQKIVEEHHELYVSNFGSLKPKYHFLLHYPTVMNNVGPLSAVSSIRFEGKHRQFKSISNIIASRVNITYSLAVRNQLWFAQRILSKKNVLNYLSYSSIFDPNFVNGEEIFLLKSNFVEFNKSYAVGLEWVKVDGIKYMLGLFIMISSQNVLPSFGKIYKIILSENKIYFFLEIFVTDWEDEHLHAYKINPTNQQICYKLENCFNLEVFENHTLPDGNNYIVKFF